MVVVVVDVTGVAYDGSMSSNREKRRRDNRLHGRGLSSVKIKAIVIPSIHITCNGFDAAFKQSPMCCAYPSVPKTKKHCENFISNPR